MGLYSVTVMLCIKRVPICSCSWWMMSRGDGPGRSSLPAVGTSPGVGDDGDCGDEDGTATRSSSSDLEMKDVSVDDSGNDYRSHTKLSAEVV
jgi:hypothetical protein